ncbi:MAG: hypothetical protein Q9178_005910 [Gyalolechia marmorata]
MAEKMSNSQKEKGHASPQVSFPPDDCVLMSGALDMKAEASVASKTQRPVDPWYKISATDDDMQDILVRQCQIYEDIIALVRARKRKVISKAASGSQIANPRPDQKKPEAKEPGLQVRISSKKPGMTLDQRAVAIFFRQHGNEERHQKNAAGLVASFLYARDENLLGKDCFSLLIKPVPQMLQTEKSASVWSKVINLWLNDCEKLRSIGFDRLLDPCVVGAINTMVEAKRRELYMEGDDEPTSIYNNAMTAYRAEMTLREEADRTAKG